MSSEIEGARFLRAEGRYNLCDTSERSANLVVQFTIDGQRYTISDTVEIGGEHDYDGEDITDAVDMIEQAIARYLYSSKREETAQNIALFRENEDAIRRVYAASQATKYQKMAARNARLAMTYLDEATQ